jgi:hypothetical protein
VQRYQAIPAARRLVREGGRSLATQVKWSVVCGGLYVKVAVVVISGGERQSLSGNSSNSHSRTTSKTVVGRGVVVIAAEIASG